MVKKYLRRLVRWAMNDDSDAPVPAQGTGNYGNSVKVRVSNDINSGNNGMNFTVYSAIGGKIVQFSTYDPIRDRSLSTLYIVTEKEDLGEEIGQILTKESLSR